MNEVQTKFDFDKVMEAFKPFDDLINKFFNTTNLKGLDLKKREMRAGSQNKLILDYFKANASFLFTPFEIQKALNLDRTPITSIRRAMTTLTELGYLIRTDTMRNGDYNEPNHCWKFNC